MQRFHLHIRHAGALVSPDDEGANFESVEAAYLEAFESAQELWPILLQDRHDPRRCSFEITNGAGEVVMEVPFSELLDNCRDAHCNRPEKPTPVFEDASLGGKVGVIFSSKRGHSPDLLQKMLHTAKTYVVMGERHLRAQEALVARRPNGESAKLLRNMRVTQSLMMSHVRLLESEIQAVDEAERQSS